MGFIEYLDVEEEENALIAMDQSYLDASSDSNEMFH